MKTEGIESIPNGGLRVSTAVFARLKAFQGGGDFWEQQDLVRESLGEFLPPVQQVQEAGECFGIFRKMVAGKEALCKSAPLGGVRVPQEEIRRLTVALEAFKRKVDAEDTQQNAKDIIQQFRLPDVSKDPDLYRLCGPWWDRKLQVLWGCERIPDSSLASVAAIAKLPIDKEYGLKRALSLFALLLVCFALLAACMWGWPVLKLWAAKTFNKPPVAAIRLDLLDETNKVATISDNGSRDPDGTLTNWRVAWGDGKEENFAQPPQEISHTYDIKRDYTISLWCVDNFGATSTPPASVEAKFDREMRLAAAAAERKAQEDARIAEDAKKEAQEDARVADENKRKAQEDARIAEDAKKRAKEALDQANTNPVPVVMSTPTTNHAPVAPEPTPGTPPPQGQSQPSEFPSSTPSGTKPARGAEVLMFRQLEIVKAGVGRLSSDNILEAMLVVRDKTHPNTPLDVLEWVVDGKAYRTRNAQLTTHLTIAEHIVSVKVRHSGIEQSAKARVVVTGAQAQTTEPDFTVSPIR